MDNASKALIMAGAILISVAIVGIGIYIFSTANALTDDAVGQIDSLAVSSWNSTLEQYFGNNVRGTIIYQLVREVNAMNRQRMLPFNILIYNHDEAVTKVVTNGDEDNGEPRTYVVQSDFKENRRYNIYADKWSPEGYIEQIHIDDIYDEEDWARNYDKNNDGVCDNYNYAPDFHRYFK